MRMKIPEKVTKRGVIHIGYGCDINPPCEFCYYRDVSYRRFLPLGSIKHIAKWFQLYYGMKEVDITGGEPTIYPPINTLIEYLNKREIKPTIITHGMHLDKVKEPCEFLISVHGTGKLSDKIMNKKGFFDIQRKQIEKTDRPIRTNTTVYKRNYKRLPEIAKYVSKFTKVHNFIMYNPFISLSDMGKIFVKYSDVTPYLEKAIGILEEKGIKVNVRYMPFCALPNNKKNIVGWRQLQFDPHEWNFLMWHQDPKDIYFNDAKWYDDKAKELLKNTNLGINNKVHYDTWDEIPFRRYGYNQSSKYGKSVKCRSCMIEDLCDGFARAYAGHYKDIDDQAKPVAAEHPIVDACHYMKENEVSCISEVAA